MSEETQTQEVDQNDLQTEQSASQEAHNPAFDNPTEPVVQESAAVSIEEASEEDLDKYDTYEEYMAATQSDNTLSNQDDPNNQGSQDNQDNQTLEPLSDITNDVPEEGTSDATSEVVEDVTMTDEQFRQFLTAEFRANNADVRVENPEDIRRLMQMGLNYQKKMAELKPQRRIVKSLEQHGLLEDSKINQMIELMEGKPEAIAALIKQHEVDTYELPDVEENPYHSGNNLVSETKLAFDEKVDTVRGAESGNQVLEYISKLDSDSYYEVYTNPDYLDALQAHAASGLMEDAIKTLAQERALGKVPDNVSEIDAYAFVADYLQKESPNKYNGSLAQSAQNQEIVSQSNPQQEQTPQQVLGNNVQQSAAQNYSNKSVSQQSAKMGASIPTNQNAGNAQYTQPVNIADMSEEELAKYDNWEDFLAKNNVQF